jgi:hypothetical protein
MIKPGFLYRRIKVLFNTAPLNETNRIVNIYNKWRDKQPKKEKHCYCGHTTTCECANPGIHEFKSGLKNGGITDEVLNKIIK